MLNTKKKANKFKAFLTVFTLCISFLFTGCNSNEVTNEVKASLGMDVSSVVHCVYIIDQSKYTAKYNMEQLLDDTISNYYQAYGSTATILRLDGEPKVVDHLSYEDNGKGGSGAWKEKDRQEAVSLIIDSIENNTSPVNAELNVLKSLRLACDELGTYTEGVKKIVIVSSLCQTMAPLNLTAGLDAYSNEDVINETVADLNNIMEIPSMEDIDSVEIFGAGYMDTSTGEQGELTALDTSNLESLWSAIFESAGATNVTFHSNTPDGNSQINDYPSVTPIKVSELNNYFICADSTTTNDNIDLTNNVLCFTETTLAFKPDSAELLSTESEALETLKPVITYATANSDAKLAIFAATAWGDDENALLELSANRAGTVKSLLIKAGVSEENMVCYSLGYVRNPYKYTCFDDDNNWNEDSARLNRVVYITDASSEAADVFYEKLN